MHTHTNSQMFHFPAKANRSLRDRIFKFGPEFWNKKGDTLLSSGRQQSLDSSPPACEEVTGGAQGRHKPGSGCTRTARRTA